jgi:hypothetical protein
MLAYDLMPGIITTLVLTPIIVILTYYFNKQYDYYHHLFLLIKEIEFDFREMQEFPKNFDSFVNKERRWLAKGVTIKSVNLIHKQTTITRINKNENVTELFNVREKSYLYNYLVDDAYVLFMNKGYSEILQNQKGFIEFIKRAFTSLKYDYSTDFDYKGGIMERITLFYFYCNEFNFLSQSFEERIKNNHYKNIEHESLHLLKEYEKYLNLISKEFCAIDTTRLKITRRMFFTKIISLITIILFILLYYLSITQGIDFNLPIHSSAIVQNYYYF